MFFNISPNPEETLDAKLEVLSVDEVMLHNPFNDVKELSMDDDLIPVIKPLEPEARPDKKSVL